MTEEENNPLNTVAHYIIMIERGLEAERQGKEQRRHQWPTVGTLETRRDTVTEMPLEANTDNNLLEMTEGTDTLKRTVTI